MKQSPEINISKVSQPMVDVPLRIHKVMVDLVHLYAARKKLSMSFCILYILRKKKRQKLSPNINICRVHQPIVECPFGNSYSNGPFNSFVISMNKYSSPYSTL